MKKLKSQKITFKGFDLNGEEKFSILGEESHFDIDNNIVKHVKYDENGGVQEEGLSTYENGLLVTEVYNCKDEGTSTVTAHRYDEQGRNTETAIQYENFRDIQRFNHGPDFTTVRFEDEDGELENLQKIWRDKNDEIIKVEFYNGADELEEIHEFGFDEQGRLIKLKETNVLEDDWVMLNVELDESGNKLATYHSRKHEAKSLDTSYGYDDKMNVIRITEEGYQETLTEYDEEGNFTETVFDLTQNRLVKLFQKNTMSGDFVEKIESSYDIRGMSITIMSALKDNVVSYEYHFENEFHD